ncbi:MAG: 2-oxoacid:acceptor oxidoreductase family protein [Candidatus Bathyarchaeia archaeon]
MTRVEIIIGGFGGQGSVLAGVVLGRAAAYDGKKVAQSRSYGAEARGGAARSEVVIADEEIDYPLVIAADYLIAMSQPAFERYIAKVKQSGLVIVEEDLVKAERHPLESLKLVKVPATKIASSEFGRPMVANMVMLGALVALTNIVTMESLIKSIKISVSRETEEVNIAALKKGQEYVNATVSGSP